MADILDSFAPKNTAQGVDPLASFGNPEEDKKVTKPPLIPVSKNNKANGARLAILAQNMPELGEGAVGPEEDLVLKLQSEFGDVLTSPGSQRPMGPVEKTIRANAARKAIATEKYAVEQTISLAPEGGTLKQEMVKDWQVLSLYEQADDDVLASQANIVDPLNDIAFYRSETPLDYETFRERMANAARAQQSISIQESIDWLTGAAEDVNVVRDSAFAYDLFETFFLPIAYGIRLGIVAEDILPNGAGWQDYILSGETTEKIKQAIIKAPPEKRAELVRELILAFDKVSGENAAFGLSNKTAMYGQLLSIVDALKEFETNDNSTDWSRWVENVFGVLSVAPVVAGTVRVSRAAKDMMGEAGYRGTYNQALLSQLPKGNEILAQTLVEGTDEGIEALATSRQAVLDSMMPSPVVDSLGNPIPTRMNTDLVASDQLINNELARQAASTPLPRAHWDVSEDPAEFKQTALRALKNSTGHHLDISKSQIGDVDYENERFLFRAFIGNDERSGFEELSRAVGARADYQLGDDAVIYGYDAATHSYKPVDLTTAVTPMKGEFYIVKDMEVGFSADMIPSLNKNQVPITKFSQIAGNWFTTGMQRYNEGLRELFRSGVRSGPALREKVRVVAMPYDNLKASDKVVVDRLLMENNGIKEFTATELYAKGLNSNQVNAYFAMRSVTNIGLSQANKVAYQNAIRDGKRWITIPGIDKSDLVKQYTKADDGIAAFKAERTKVYDPDTGTSVSMGAKEVEREYQNGGHLVKLDHALDIGGSEDSLWVIVRPNSTAKLQDVPKSIIKKVPGYMPRYTDHKYMVFATRTRKRGDKWVKVEEPIYYAKSLAEAKKHVDVLNKAPSPDAGVTYRAGVTKEIEAGWYGNSNALYEVENLMFFQKRNTALDELTGKEAFVDPTTALDRFSSAITSKIHEGRLVENYQKKWSKAYGYLFPDLRGGFPTNRAGLDNVRRFGDEGIPPGKTQAQYMADRDAAIAGFDWINGITRGPTSMGTWAAKNFGERLGVTLAGAHNWYNAPTRALGDWLVSKPDPIRFLRSVAYIHQILSAPLKQWIINAPTLAVHAGIDAPKAIRAMGVDAAYLDVMYQAERHGVKASGTLARAIVNLDDKVASDDLKALHRAFTDSGFAEIHSNSMVMDRSWFGADTVKAINSTKDKVLHAAGELGSASAERHNAAAAFSMAARLHAEATKVPISQFTKADWRKVTDRAAAYALSLTKEDAFNYQRGLFAATFQYMAIRHKAMQAVLTNGDMTKGQKAKSLLFLGTLYGAEGVGGAYAVNAAFTSMGWEWDTLAAEINQTQLLPGTEWDGQSLKQAVDGGVSDVVFNQMFDRIFDEEGNDVNISKAISPLSGIDRTVAAFAMGLSGGFSSIGDVALGPSESVLGNYARLIDAGMKAVEYDLKDDKAVDNLIRSAYMLTSGGSNLVKAFEGAALNAIVARNGSPQANATLGELYAQGVFGFSSEQVEEFWEAKALMGNDSKEQAERMDDETTEIAQYYTELLFHSEDYDTFNERAKYIKAVLDAYKADPGKNPDVAELIGTKIAKNLTKFETEATVRFYDRMIEQVLKNDVDDPVRVLRALRNTTHVMNNPLKKQAIDELLEDYQSKKERIEGAAK